MIVLLAAALPVRVVASFPIIQTVSVLDVLLILVAVTLVLDLSFRPLDTGDRRLFLLLCLPLVLSVLSLVWSQDRPATLRASLVYAEGVVAYLFVVRELDGLSPARVITYIKRYAYLLIIPGVLLLLHVPGFHPQVDDVSRTSGEYISFFSRLSHPILGRSNNLATVLAFFAPLLLYWGHTRRDRRATLAAIVTFLAIFLTLSRGVLLAFVVAGLFYLLVAGRSSAPRGGMGSKVAATVALGAVAIAFFYSVNPATHEFFGTRFGVANVSERSTLISMSLPKIENRPFLGYGAGVAPENDPLLAEGVHNTFVQQVLYFGLPLGLVMSAILLGIAGVFLARRRVQPIAGVIAYAVMVELVIFAVESSFEGTVLRLLFYLSIGLAVGLLRAVESETRSPQAQPG